jgi:enterochelin esterase-like enzyme
MKSLRSVAFVSLTVLALAGTLAAQQQGGGGAQRGAGAARGGQAGGGAANRGGGGRGAQAPIVLGADDKPAYPAAPAGFDARREGIAHGTVELVEYDSKSVGAKRRLNVYLPPGYSKDTKYPVFYLLHGAGGNETGWQRQGAADNILDNLYAAERKPVAMIVVMPNGIPQTATTQPAVAPATPQGGRGFQAGQAGQGGRGGGAAPAAGGRGGGAGGGRGGGAGGRGNVNYNATNALFETDLLKDIIPFVEARYPVLADRQHRALAGLSLGGGQSLVIGTKHQDMFAHIGGFSSAIIGAQPATLAADAEGLTKNMKVLWISCGDRDSLITSSQNLHQALKDKKVPHVWHLDSGAHEWPVWKNDLYLLTPLLFK